MWFSIQLALLRIKKNLSYNFFIALQLFLGFTILCTAFNMNYSMLTRLNALKNETNDSEIRVDILSDSIDTQFQYSTFTAMRRESNCNIGITTTAIVKAKIDGIPDSVVALCVPERYFYKLFSMDIEENHVYCSRFLYDSIVDNKVVLFGSGTEISLTNDYIVLNDHTYPLKVLDTSEITEITRDDNPSHNIPLDKVLIFSQDVGEFWEDEEFVSFQIYFYPTSPEYYLNAYKILYSHLQDTSISIYDPAAFLLKSSQDIVDIADISTLISIVLLLTSIIGTIGILFISIYKRKKDMAVAVAIGAPIQKIYLELFIECFIVCAFGILLGALAAFGTTTILKNVITLFDVYYAPQTICIVLGMIFLTPIVVTKISASGIRKVDLMTSLHGGE